MHFTVRQATPADFEWALATHHAAYRDVILATYGVWEEAVQDGYFKRSWVGEKFDVLVCAGQACGYTAVENRVDDFYVDELVIHPDFQGRGIGTAFLRMVMDRAEKQGMSVRLRTCLKNRAVGLYLRLGFREYERTGTHVLLEWAITEHCTGPGPRRSL